MPDTARLIIPYPTGDDEPDGPSQMQAIAERVDDVAPEYLQGVFSSRPAAGHEGRFFFATDTDRLYYDDGSTWNSIFATAGTAAGTFAAGDDARITRAEADLATYKTLWRASTTIVAGAVTIDADYLMPSSGTPFKATYSGTTGDNVDAGGCPALFYYDPNRYVIAGKTPKLYLVGSCFTDGEASLSNAASVEVLNMKAPVAGKWALAGTYSGPGATFASGSSGAVGANSMMQEVSGVGINAPGSAQWLAFHLIPNFLAAGSAMHIQVACQLHYT